MTTACKRLTDKQAYYLWHLSRTGETSDRAVVRQLEAKGLVAYTYTRERCEWNRVVARLHVCIMTASGKAFIEDNTEQIKQQREAYLNREKAN